MWQINGTGPHRRHHPRARRQAGVPDRRLRALKVHCDARARTGRNGLPTLMIWPVRRHSGLRRQLQVPGRGIRTPPCMRLLPPLARSLARSLVMFGLRLFAPLLAGARLPMPRMSLPPSAEGVRIRLVLGPVHTDFLLPLSAETRAAGGGSGPDRATDPGNPSPLGTPKRKANPTCPPRSAGGARAGR